MMMKKKWTKPEVKRRRKMMELMIRLKLEDMADSLEHQLLCHDFQGLPFPWHPKVKQKPLTLKDDPRCRIKLGG